MTSSMMLVLLFLLLLLSSSSLFTFFLSTTSTVSKCSDEDFYWAFNVDEQKKEKMIYNKEELEMMSSFTVSFVF